MTTIHILPRTTAHGPRPTSPRAFTLMELMVSISILILIIVGVGITFSGATRSVGISQATMDMLGNQRAVAGAMERDIQSMDKNAFLVIRQRIVPIGYVVNGQNVI